ncbi:hypothetical protein CB1_001264041 [Camelus ferus]|nr:hypothetical protein CB1_001264041 [Camelus ferus]
MAFFMSAPFVAGQIDDCMDNPAVFLPVPIGFNPVSMASLGVQGHSAPMSIKAQPSRKLLTSDPNPNVVFDLDCHPEGLNGSSQMKGGSATKILLKTLLMAAHKTVDRGITASQSLEKKGQVYLVGWQTLGIIAIMDVIECIHTFGAGGTPV